MVTRMIKRSFLAKNKKTLTQASELSEVSRLIHAVLASHFFHPLTVGVEELAPIFKKSTNSIYSDLVRRPDALPPPLEIVEDGRLLWLYEDVVAWLKAHRAPSSTQGAPLDDAENIPQRRRRSHSPHTEKIAHKSGVAKGASK